MLPDQRYYMRLIKSRLCTIAHWETIKQLLAFLAGTKNYGIFFSGKNLNTDPFHCFHRCGLCIRHRKAEIYNMFHLSVPRESPAVASLKEKIPLMQNEGAQEIWVSTTYDGDLWNKRINHFTIIFSLVGVFKSHFVFHL